MARDYPIPNSAPIDATAARIMGRGVQYDPAITNPEAVRLEAPLPCIPYKGLKPLIRGANNNMKGGTRSYRDFTGAVYGNLTIIGFLGGRRSKEMWLAKCLCGDYTKRRDKTLRKKRNNSFDYCPDCEARDQAQARYAFQATGIYRLLKTDPNAAKEDAVRRRRDRLTVPSDKS